MMHVDTVSIGGLPYAERAIEQLRDWPALNLCQADCGAGMGVAVHTHQIVHLHRPDEAELCLTWPVIQRLSTALDGNRQVSYMRGSDWIRLRLDCDGDVMLLSSLVSVAIQADARSGDHLVCRHHMPCPQSDRAATLRSLRLDVHEITGCTSA
jgi:hypothetical protein